MSRTKGDKIFDVCNVIFMLLLTFIMFYPLYFTVIASLSEPLDVARGNVRFWPVNFTIQSYRQVFAYSQIWIGYRNTIFYTVFGTLFSLFLTVPAAYTLSKKFVSFRGPITFFFVFTMYFGGGMVPTFLLVMNLGLMNTPWVMIILGGFSVWNLIVTRVFFMTSIPEDLFESARIDGASDFRQFFTIALPLAKPVIAVITLWYAVGNWNAFFNALLYIRDSNLEPLQLVLRRVLIQEQAVLDEAILADALQPGELVDMVRRQHAALTMRYAMVFIAAFPLLVMYPFIQKYFVKGVMVGSLKG